MPRIRRIVRLLTLFPIIAIVCCDAARGQAKRRVYIPGQQAIVVDERLSALRAQPDAKAALDQRLRRGRAVGILGAATARSGARYLRVAISRNQRGWVLADAVARLGGTADAVRLMALIETTEDEFTKARLARLLANEFRATAFGPKALRLLGSIAEQAAERLTREAQRRIGDLEPGQNLSRREYFLNYSGLDRYNRLGITFDYDEASNRIVYDGAAYRELLRRYPNSEEAKALRKQ
jgi:hypothetical protein